MNKDKIILTGENNHLFEFEILNYQFPEEKEDYDANWIVLDIKARNKLGRWHKQSPCMLTWEIKWFIKWLEKITMSLINEDEIFCYEFDFGMSYHGKTKNSHKFKVYLKYGLSFYDLDSPLNSESCIVSLVLTNDEVNNTIKTFLNWQNTFIPKGEIGMKMNDYYPDYLK